MWLQILIAVVVLFVLQYVVRPMIAMRYYTGQGGHNLGYLPLIGAFGKCFISLKQTKDVFRMFKDVGLMKPKPDMCVTNLLHKVQVYLVNVDLIQEFIAKNEFYDRERMGMEHLEVLFGPGILIANGADWARRRKLVASLFHHNTVKDMSAAITIKIRTLFEQRAKQGKLDVLELAQEATVQNIMQFVFGADEFVSKTTAIMAKLLNEVMLIELIKSPLFMILRDKYFTWGVTKTARDIMRTTNEVRAHATRLIQYIESEKAKGRVVKGSMIGNYLDSVDNKGSTRDALIDDILHLFLAGKDTSSSVITICAYYLCAHPDRQHELRQEIDAAPAELSYDVIDGLRKMGNFVNEVLRHSGFPGTLLNRIAKEDHDLLGVRVKKGTTITPMVVANYYDDQYFPECEKFNPDRFEDEKQRNLMMSSLAFMPFGSGPRSCIGKSLALINVKAYLALLLRTYQFQLPPNYDYTLGFNKSVCPQQRVILTVKPRQ